MNAKEICEMLFSDPNIKYTNFLRVYPIDRIPSTAYNKYPCSVIVNTKPHYDPGEHWVLIHKTETNKGIFFYSYGNPPYTLPEVGGVLEGCNERVYNNTQLQSPFSTVCGQYTMFVLSHLAKGFTLEHIIYLINDSGDTHANDSFIFNYTKNKYRDINTSHLKIIDLPFIFNRLMSDSVYM